MKVRASYGSWYQGEVELICDEEVVQLLIEHLENNIASYVEAGAYDEAEEYMRMRRNLVGKLAEKPESDEAADL